MPVEPTDWLGLRGRVAVVTGAARGIGFGIAKGLAEVGAKVALLDVGDSADAAAASLKADGAEAIGLSCDVSNAEAIERAAAEVNRLLGPCDHLVNNAGVVRAGALATLSLADWRALLDINLTGAFLCAQIFGRPMLERQRGSVVHVASIAAEFPQGFSGAYSVSKAGLVMLSNGLAAEWGPRGVRSNCVSPCMIRTPMMEPLLKTEGVKEKREALIPAGRLGTPKDMADAAIFLLSDRAAFISGQDVMVDGGFKQVLLDLIPRPGFQRKDHT